MVNQRLVKVFVMESEDNLSQMEDSLLQLESDPEDKEALNVLFRATHSIKGSSGVVGLDTISSFTHLLENLLDKVRHGNLTLTPPILKLILACRDHLANWIALSHEENAEDAELLQTTKSLQARLDEQLRTAATPSPAKAKARAKTKKTPASTASADAEAITLSVDAAGLLHTLAQDIKLVESGGELIGLGKKFAGYATYFKEIGAFPKQEPARRLSRLLKEYSSRCGVQVLHPDDCFLTALRSCRDAVNAFDQYIRKFPEKIRAGDFPETNQILLQNAIDALREALKTTHTNPAQAVIAQAIPVTESGDYAVEVDNWHISLRFKPNALKEGVEPLDTLNYLAQSGIINHLTTLPDAMPAAEEMDPSICYLGFELGFITELSKTRIENLFDVIRDYCEVRILPPHSHISRYIQLLDELPEDTVKMGEILIQIGTLTQRELDDGLTLQQHKKENPPQTQKPIGEILVNQGVVQQDVVNAAANRQQGIKHYQDIRRQMLNVNATKLDQLIDLVGELVITNAGLHLLSKEINDERLKKTGVMMSRLIEEIRNRTLSMRMVAIGEVFSRFRRLVHDMNDTLGKQVTLQISGAETELDKSMISKITDPLTHLVRNAIDHGIETKEKRLAAGKSEQGTLQLNACQDSGNIVIEVVDDGCGLDTQKILQKAIEKGLAEAGKNYSEQEIHRFIFEPGLSTNEQVTDLSGRGVGLDVVKRNISALNGTVDIQSESGRGTAMRIYLPLTLAIIDGFLMAVGDSSFVVPLDRVVRCIKYTQAYQEEGRSGYINLHGRALPLLHVDKLFEIKNAGAVKRRNIVVVHYGSQEAGLVVDSLQGEFQAVIKPLGKIFEAMSGLSGATILGNGEVALILDIPALVTRYNSGAYQALPQTGQNDKPETPGKTQTQPT